MVLKRQTGGLKTFVDDGTHNSVLSAEEAATINDAYTKAKKRMAKEKQLFTKLKALFV